MSVLIEIWITSSSIFPHEVTLRALSLDDFLPLFKILPHFKVLLVTLFFAIIACEYSTEFILHVIAFVKERFHNAVESDILGFFEGYSSLQIWSPKKTFQGRNYSGRMT